MTQENDLENKRDGNFEKSMEKFMLISMHDTLEENNNVNTIPFGCDKKYAAYFCEKFEERYNKKLNHTMKKGICYFHY